MEGPAGRLKQIGHKSLSEKIGMRLWCSQMITIGGKGWWVLAQDLELRWGDHQSCNLKDDFLQKLELNWATRRFEVSIQNKIFQMKQSNFCSSAGHPCEFLLMSCNFSNFKFIPSSARETLSSYARLKAYNWKLMLHKELLKRINSDDLFSVNLIY